MANDPTTEDRPGLVAVRMEREIRAAIAEYLWYLKENEARGGIITREHQLALTHFALLRISDAIGLAIRRGFPINDAYRRQMLGMAGGETLNEKAARFLLVLDGEAPTDEAIARAKMKVEERRATQGVAYFAAVDDETSVDDDDPHGSQASDGGC